MNASGQSQRHPRRRAKAGPRVYPDVSRGRRRGIRGRREGGFRAALFIWA